MKGKGRETRYLKDGTRSSRPVHGNREGQVWTAKDALIREKNF